MLSASDTERHNVSATQTVWLGMPTDTYTYISLKGMYVCVAAVCRPPVWVGIKKTGLRRSRSSARERTGSRLECDRMPFQKGRSKTGGRQKGSLNKSPSDRKVVKTAAQKAAEDGLTRSSTCSRSCATLKLHLSAETVLLEWRRHTFTRSCKSSTAPSEPQSSM